MRQNDKLIDSVSTKRHHVGVSVDRMDCANVAQASAAMPAMCDAIIRGEPSMELSLFSRDVIAMRKAIALSHDVFDAALLLGVC